MMRKALRWTALAAAMAASSAWAGGTHDDVQVVRAWFDDADRIEAVAPLLGHAQIDRNKGLLRTEADAWLRAELIAAGFRVEIDRDATDAMQRSAQAFSLATSGAKSIPGYACYRTVEEAEARLDALAIEHPDLVSLVDIGPSWQEQQNGTGYQLRVARATNSAIPGPKPALFLVGSIHAREYTPAELLLRFFEDLVDTHGTDADATWILDHHEIHVLVHANPDGRKRAEAGQLWRKNTNPIGCSTSSQQGIDLNRNFPFHWNGAGGSSGQPCNDTYRGPSPASEPETQAIVDYTQQLFPDNRGPGINDPAPDDTPGIFMDVHSYSQLVLWPWGFTEDTAPNATALSVLGRRLAGFNGYTAQASVGLYPTDGTTDDFAYGELGVAAYTFELGTAFFQDCSSFENVIEPDNRAALRYAARVLRAPYRLPAGPDATDVRVDPDLILVGDTATLHARFDDERQQTGTAANSGPVPAVQPIAAANGYLEAPWLPGAVASPLQAVDGAFNTPVEEAAGTVDTSALPAGRHLVYAQASDTSGAVGPVGAAFVEIVAPEDAATLEGRITDVVSGDPLVARIDVGPWRSSSDAAGEYARVLRPGTWDLRVSAPGYETEIEPALSVAAGDELTRNIALYRTCEVIDDPVELAVPSPFTPQSPWQKRAGAGQDGGAAWLQSASGNYASNLDISLTSAVLDLAGYTSVSLTFDQRCDTEADWDYGIVEVSSNGGSNWSEVFRCDGETSWRSVDLPLPQLDGQASARVRFRFDSDTSVTEPGWAVDNIALHAGGASCRASQVPAVAIVDFDATPSSIAAGGTSTLAWTTQNATDCSIGNSLDATTHVIAPEDVDAGTWDVSPASDVVYTLACNGSAGSVSAQASVTVTAPPPVAILAFDATPASITLGDDSTLSWTTEHATACSIDGDDGSTHAIASNDLDTGSLLVTPDTDVTYTLTCDGEAGPAASTTTVDVTAPLPPEIFADGFEPAP